MNHELDRSSHIFKHLLNSESCRVSCSADCFEILDSASTTFQIKLKESMYIKWEKPSLNQQHSLIASTMTSDRLGHVRVRFVVPLEL